MSDDAFTQRIGELRAQASRNETSLMGSLGRPADPDAVIDPPDSRETHPNLAQLVARDLLQLAQRGRITFGEVMVRGQVEEAARQGTWTARGNTQEVPADTLVTVLALAMRQQASSGRRAPCYVVSLLRNRAGVSSPHNHGLGIDLLVYDGHYFRGPTQSSFEGVIKLVRNLPEGRFQLGLPRAPRENRTDYDRYRRFQIERHPVYRQDLSSPQFSPRFRRRMARWSRHPGEAWAGPNAFFPADAEIRRSPSHGRGLAADLAYFTNPANAAEFQRAADASDGDVRTLFPDEPNHVHITVDTGGAWSSIRRRTRS